jgi:pimeloyl-ACP methyl ester carboxylesterase
VRAIYFLVAISETRHFIHMGLIASKLRRQLGRLIANASIAGLALLVIFLLSFSFFISSDLPREAVIEKYRNEASFFYRLPSGATAHIRDQGRRDGPVVFLIHGSNASLHTWEPWVEALEAQYRLISFDLPGHGLTGATPADAYSVPAMTRFTKEIADLFKIDRLILAGNSMGGAVAMQFALDYPVMADALVLVSPGGMMRDPEEGSVGAFRLIDKAWGRELMRYVTPKFMVGLTLRGVVADADNFVTDEQVTRYWEMLRMTGSRDASIKRFAGYENEGALEPQLSGIRIPTLILWGQQDRLIKVDYGIRMNALIAGSLLKLYPQAGHLAHEEIPELTARDAAQFLAEALDF